MEAENHLFEKEHHLKPTSMTLGSKCWFFQGCISVSKLSMELFRNYVPNPVQKSFSPWSKKVRMGIKGIHQAMFGKSLTNISWNKFWKSHTILTVSVFFFVLGLWPFWDLMTRSIIRVPEIGQSRPLYSHSLKISVGIPSYGCFFCIGWIRKQWRIKAPGAP